MNITVTVDNKLNQLLIFFSKNLEISIRYPGKRVPSLIALSIFIFLPIK
jgi:hypothetical protein